jgi:hypothetical protein
VRLRAAMRPWAQNDEGRVQMKEMGREAMGLTTNSTTVQERKTLDTKYLQYESRACEQRIKKELV